MLKKGKIIDQNRGFSIGNPQLRSELWISAELWNSDWNSNLPIG